MTVSRMPRRAPPPSPPSGAAPAVQIGSATMRVTIGAVAGNANGHGLVINGAIAGSGVYAGVNANGILIGGLGGNVTDRRRHDRDRQRLRRVERRQRARRSGSATARRVNEIRNSGAIRASGGRDAADVAAPSRSIRARRSPRSATAARSARAPAAPARRRDRRRQRRGRRWSRIAARSSAARRRRARAAAIAIDLGDNNTGATVRQTVVGQGVAGAADRRQHPVRRRRRPARRRRRHRSRHDALRRRRQPAQLSGDAAFPARVEFGAGADRLALAGTSTFAGRADFGGGADVLETRARRGSAARCSTAAGLAVQVSGGTFGPTQTGNVAIGSLTVGATAARRQHRRGGRAPTRLPGRRRRRASARARSSRSQLANVSASVGTYTFLQAGTLTGGGQLHFAMPACLPVQGGLAVEPAPPTRSRSTIGRQDRNRARPQRLGGPRL